MYDQFPLEIEGIKLGGCKYMSIEYLFLDIFGPITNQTMQTNLILCVNVVYSICLHSLVCYRTHHNKKNKSILIYESNAISVYRTLYIYTVVNSFYGSVEMSCSRLCFTFYRWPHVSKPILTKQQKTQVDYLTLNHDLSFFVFVRMLNLLRCIKFTRWEPSKTTEVRLTPCTRNYQPSMERSIGCPPRN